MTWQIPLVTSGTNVSAENFWKCVFLYHDRPNIVNRRLSAVAQVLLCELSLSCSTIQLINEIFTKEAILYETRKFEELATISPCFINRIVRAYDTNARVTPTNWESFQEKGNGIFLSARVLLARHKNEKCLEIAIIDKTENRATFFAVQEDKQLPIAPRFCYHIELTQAGHLRISLNSEDANSSSAEWLTEKLFPKLIKWSSDEKVVNTVNSLTLVSPSEYTTLYSELKTKYAKSLIHVWSEKAKTNPQKYIFEDLAIATYLICLWRKVDAPVNFIDCGCGNGLLVYVLNEEGYNGCGLDIRYRKVWEIYIGKADLRVEPVTPSSTFPEATWIIGNHSDELTPWIPVIALKSHPKTNFFVLPCCTYDFNGHKYVRRNTALTQYSDYLNYIESISVMCGFKTLVDKLKIPSTKRTCLIGLRKEYTASELAKINTEVTDFVNLRTEHGFILRSAKEEVRNCTKLDRNLKQEIVQLIVNKLLAVPHNLEKKSESQLWNKGCSMTLGDLSREIPKEKLKLLKKEFGGLQTLLKNHRYIFEVAAGNISLRIPPTVKDTTKYQEKLCWFYEHHPNQCLHKNDICAYKHNEK